VAYAAGDWAIKLVPGRCEYPLPDCGLLESVAVDAGVREMRGILYVLQRFTPEQWGQIRGDPTKPPTCGMPLYFAWFETLEELRVYPAPAEAHELRVRYYPHLREA